MLTKAAFDPETVSLLGAVLDQAIAALPPERRTQERKTLLAAQILSAASSGERDPARLQAAALAVGPYAARRSSAGTSTDRRRSVYTARVSRGARKPQITRTISAPTTAPTSPAPSPA